MTNMSLWFAVLLVGASVCAIQCCDEATCGSIVSKCMLINSCDCDMTNIATAVCGTNCSMCLADLYTDCCECVGMCAPKDPEEELGNISSVGNLKDAIPDLFKVLTEEEDMMKRWTSYTYLSSDVKPGSNIMRINGTKAQRGLTDRTHTTDNCTVSFMAECMSMKNCKDACKSMGSSIYRWFHGEGCCECIGHTCLGYGIHEPQCDRCVAEDKVTLTEEVVSEVKGDDVDNIVNAMLMDQPAGGRQGHAHREGKQRDINNNEDASDKEDDMEDDDDIDDDDDDIDDEIDKEIEEDEDDTVIDVTGI